MFYHSFTGLFSEGIIVIQPDAVELPTSPQFILPASTFSLRMKKHSFLQDAEERVIFVPGLFLVSLVLEVPRKTVTGTGTQSRICGIKSSILMARIILTTLMLYPRLLLRMRSNPN